MNAAVLFRLFKSEEQVHEYVEYWTPKLPYLAWGLVILAIILVLSNRYAKKYP